MRYIVHTALRCHPEGQMVEITESAFEAREKIPTAELIVSI